MAAGCVLVSSDLLQDVSDFIGRVGFTYPEGSPDGLARVLGQLRDHPEVCERYGRLARERAELYPWSRTIDAYERLLTQLHLRRLIEFATGRCRDLEELFQTLLSQVVNVGRADGGAIAGVEPDGSLGVQAASGNSRAASHWITGQAGLYAFVAEQKRAIQAPDDVAHTYLEDCWKRSDENGSGLFAPIIAGGRLLGVIELVRRSDREPFSTDDVGWLACWGEEAGEAIARSRLLRAGQSPCSGTEPG